MYKAMLINLKTLIKPIAFQIHIVFTFIKNKKPKETNNNEKFENVVKGLPFRYVLDPSDFKRE